MNIHCCFRTFMFPYVLGCIPGCPEYPSYLFSLSIYKVSSTRKFHCDESAQSALDAMTRNISCRVSTFTPLGITIGGRWPVLKFAPCCEQQTPTLLSLVISLPKLLTNLGYTCDYIPKSVDVQRCKVLAPGVCADELLADQRVFLCSLPGWRRQNDFALFRNLPTEDHHKNKATSLLDSPVGFLRHATLLIF